MLQITLTKGLVGKTKIQRKVVAALGLGKYGSSVLRQDSAVIRGMINKVSHLVTVTKDGAGAVKALPGNAMKVAKKAGKPGEASQS